MPIKLIFAIIAVVPWWMTVVLTTVVTARFVGNPS